MRCASLCIFGDTVRKHRDTNGDAVHAVFGDSVRKHKDTFGDSVRKHKDTFGDSVRKHKDTFGDSVRKHKDTNGDALNRAVFGDFVRKRCWPKMMTPTTSVSSFSGS
jgi:L-arabinose isomerase